MVFRQNGSDEDEILKRFEEEKIDVVVLAGYLAIVGDKLIEQYKNRIINIHPHLFHLSVVLDSMECMSMKLCLKEA